MTRGGALFVALSILAGAVVGIAAGMLTWLLW